METLPWVWFGFSALIGILVWVFLIWLAWRLVSAVRGMQAELAAIRKVLEAR